MTRGIQTPRAQRGWLPEELIGWLQWTAAVLIGAVVPASGFAPLDHTGGVLNLTSRPFLVVLMPSVLLAAVGAVAAAVFPRRPAPLARPVVVAGCLFALAGGLSIIGSDDRIDSLVVLITAILAPMVLLVALRHSALPMRTVCIAFLAVTTAFLLRDDWVFIRDYGFPTGTKLFQAKFTNSPYDFHYYGLQNPDMFATFLLIPLTLSSLWASEGDVGRLGRILLVCAAAISAFTLLLTYVRFDIALGWIIILWACATARMPRGSRAAAVGLVLAAGLAAILSGKTRSYLFAVTSTNPSASGAVRFSAIGDGLREMVHHPLTGVGLDRYGSTQVLPAHSALAQAGADLGILGFLSLGLVMIWLLREGWLGLRWRRWLGGLPAAAAVAAGVYALTTALTGGSRLGFYVNFVDIPALAVVLMIAATEQPQHARSSEQPVTGPRARVWLPMQSGIAAVLGCLVVTAAAVATTHQTQPPLSARPLDAGVAWQKAAAWSFVRALPSGWSALGGARVTPRGRRMVKVVMGGGSQTSQIIGPELTLAPGRYGIDITGKVKHGRVSIGLLDVHSAGRFAGAQLTASDTSDTTKVSVEVPQLTTARLVVFRSRPANGQAVVALRTVDLVLLGSGPERWSFAGRLPTGWHTTQATAVRMLATAASVDADRQPEAYQLLGPAVTLLPGTYRMAFVGQVLRGRFSLGLLDVGTDKFIGERRLVSSTTPTRAGVTISVARRSVVRLILSNWALAGSQSACILREITIRPAAPTGR